MPRSRLQPRCRSGQALRAAEAHLAGWERLAACVDLLRHAVHERGGAGAHAVAEAAHAERCAVHCERVREHCELQLLLHALRSVRRVRRAFSGGCGWRERARRGWRVQHRAGSSGGRVAGCRTACGIRGLQHGERLFDSHKESIHLLHGCWVQLLAPCCSAQRLAQ